MAHDERHVIRAAAMNVLNPVHALKYGGFWATGADNYEARLHDAPGFESHEHLLGVTYVGTPQTPAAPPQRPARDAHVREWVPQASS